MSTIEDSVSSIPMQSPAPGAFGCEVPPKGPLQDMFASIDPIAGGSARERNAPQADFTGGMGGMGIGGMAEPPSPIADSDGGPQQDVP